MIVSFNKASGQAAIYSTVLASGNSNTSLTVVCEGSSMQLLLVVHYTGFNYVSATYNNNASNDIGNIASGNDHISMFMFSAVSGGKQTVKLSVVGTGTYYTELFALKNVSSTNSISITTTSTSGTNASVSVSGESKDLLIGGIFDLSCGVTSISGATSQEKIASFTSPYAGEDDYVSASSSSKFSWSFSSSTSYTAWAVKISGTIALPISLLDFDTQYVPDRSIVDINWTTATEIDNSYFTIEKTTDGINYTTVATVAGAGNSDHVLNYSTVDESPWGGTSYYRLKQTDYDGNYTYSGTMIVNVPLHYAVNIFPNPASDHTVVQYNSDSPAPLIVEIFNAQGMLVSSYDFATVQTGDNRFTINTASLSQGAYIMRLTSGTTTTSHKFIKQ
ncbi:MAG TPA: T9SS type A sorting domain-containing protein [Bacteroidia bacterium]|nr:T9SS type A sorting domain-containing protein [Bacteroidia bacterium]